MPTYDVEAFAEKIRAVMWKLTPPIRPPERVRVEDLEDGGRQIVIRFGPDEVAKRPTSPAAKSMGVSAGWENPKK